MNNTLSRYKNISYEERVTPLRMPTFSVSDKGGGGGGQIQIYKVKNRFGKIRFYADFPTPR